jgi:hypothetical protein
MANQYQSRVYELQSFTGTPGVVQSLQYDLRGLPRGQRVSAFMVVADCELTYTQGGGQPATIATENYNLASKLLGQFDHQSSFFKVRATGAGLYRLFQHMNGRGLQDDQVFLPTAQPTFARPAVVIPLQDTNQFAPTDTAIPTELINGTSLQLVTTGASLGSLGFIDPSTGAPVVAPAITGTVVYRLFACLIEGSGAIDPTPTAIDYEDWGGQTILLAPGAYTHLSVYRDPLAQGGGGNISMSSDLTRVTWNIAGTPVNQNVFSWALTMDYNRNSVAGGFVDNDREQLQSNQVPFVPIYTPPSKYKLTGLPQTDQPDSIIQLNGSLTYFRVLYRRIPQKTESQVRTAAQAFGLSSFQRQLKTASKSPVGKGSILPSDIARRADLSKIIPGRLIGSKSGGKV